MATRRTTTAARTHLQGLRGLRQALSSTHARHDRAAPVMQTRDLAIPTEAGPLLARLYQPQAWRPPGPAMMYFHGGGFVICDLETHDSLCRWLAFGADMTVLSIGYRLAPEAPFPAQLDDGEAAARWAIDNAGELGLDPARLLVGGDSAGGYIAVAVAAKLNAERPAAVAGQILLYPLLELGDEAWTSSIFAHSRIIGRVAVGYIRSQLGPRADDAATLLDLDPSLMPPTVIAAGGHLDPCRPDAKRLAHRLRDAGRPIAQLNFPRLPHGFGSITHVSAASRRAMAEVGAATRDLAAALA